MQQQISDQLHGGRWLAFRRPPPILVFVGVVCAAGAAALLAAVASEGFAWAGWARPHLVLLLTATVLAELKPIEVPRGSEAENITTSTTFAYALTLGWGPVPAILALWGASIIFGLRTGRPAWKVAFNGSQYALSVTATAWMLGLVTDLPRAGAIPASGDIIPVILAGSAFFLVNNTLVATALALAQRRPIVEVNLQDFSFQAMSAFALIALAPIVLVLLHWSLLLVPLLVFPMVALYRGRRASLEKKQTEDRFRAMAQNAAELVSITDPEGTFQYLSPSLHTLLGYRPEDLIGTSAFDLVHPDDVPRATAVLTDLLTNPGRAMSIEMRVRNADGQWRHFEAVCNNLLETPSVAGIVVNSRDITERKLLENELAHQAFHDVLTGLANRALFRDRVEHALARASRAGTTGSVGVLFLDLDDFKTINDSLGHAAGDHVLVEVGQRILSCLRPGDTAARLGGDEFAVLLEDVSPQEATIVADRMRGVLAERLVVQRKELSLRASVGIALARPHDGAEDLLRNADVAMYAAKGHGKSRYEIFDPSMHSAAMERLELEADLDRAAERDELFLHYQPIVSLVDGRIAGLEALARWRHPRRGLLSPAAFIPLAEDSGLIVAVGKWVLRTACIQAAEWRRRFPVHDSLSISVNLSVKQLRDPGLVDDVAAALAEARLDPAALVLEITESVLMQDAEEALRRLEEVKALGVRIAIDDFGTGYSSLSYLRRLPVNILKIDRSFVEGLARDAEDSALAKAIVQMARTLALETVAEGIERPEQLLRLKALGCDLGQGFLLSPPASGESIAEMLGEPLTPWKGHLVGSPRTVSGSRSL